MAQPLRMLVVDDTVTYRKIVSDVLAGIPDVTVLGSAANGRIAMSKIDELKPDVITLDLEMPEMNGLEVLSELRKKNNPVGVIMLSAFTTAGAKATVEALNLGAFDFVLKPQADDLQKGMESLQKELTHKLNAFERSRQIRSILSGGASASKPASTSPPAKSFSGAPPREIRPARMSGEKKDSSPEIVVLGISTGGPQALTRMLPMLPSDFSVPVLIVQHMPPLFTKSLAEDLNRRCALNVSEAIDGEPVEPGHIYIAPGGKQMKVQRPSGRLHIQITNDPPENSCCPAADYLFRSACHICGAKTLAVIMTGMGVDGNLGCRLLKRAGAQIIAQDAASCVVFGMPRQIVEERIADAVVSLDTIASEIVQRTGQGIPLCV